ncbi:MAG: Ppx/GppA family phosphatase, partial [Gammaproteobacteria bacterium]|nr:Ppx/GppA family phosphatase [Gammaproteobacteria bacterium]
MAGVLKNLLSEARNDSSGKLVAAVDLGSNSFHLLVARRRGEDLHIMDRLRDPIRLGAGFDENNLLTEQVTTRALDCLRRFGERLKDLDNRSVRAVGTNALRKARNSKEFLARANEALGFPIQVISGIEEARLIYLGVAHSLAANEQRRLVIDIGGGSTELIIGEANEPLMMESLFLGCVSLTQEFFAKGVINKKSMKRAQLQAKMQLEVIKTVFKRKGWVQAVGASGSIRAIDGLCRAHVGADEAITLKGLKQLEKLLINAGSVEGLGELEITEDRAAVLPGGLAILIAIFESLQIDRMDKAGGALREGLILDLLGRQRHEDTRDRTVKKYLERYRLDVAHGQRVKAAVLHMLESVKRDWALEDESVAQLLGWAAQLCELGLAVAHSQFHKHGAYILEHADLAGFTRQEQAVLASLVRAHRRKFPTAIFSNLTNPWQDIGIRAAILLRLAVLFNRGRSDESMPPVDIYADEERLKLKFPEGWLEAHPLTQADLEEEARLISSTGIKLKFK